MPVPQHPSSRGRGGSAHGRPAVSLGTLFASWDGQGGGRTRGYQMTIEAERGGASGDEEACMACRARGWPWPPRCRPGSACLFAQGALGVHRFFRRNPVLGTRCATSEWPARVRRAAAARVHPYFAAELLHDADRRVRCQAVKRAPRERVSPLREDVDTGVRAAVARKLWGNDLIIMMDDPEVAVRRIVASRITPHLLPLMLGDADPHVRRVLARRIDASWLAILAEDPIADVRAIVAGRLRWAPQTAPSE